MSLSQEPELIADYACETGEGPLWHPGEQRLYWLDIPAGRIFRYDPATSRHELFFHGIPTGGITLQEDGSLLLFMARGAVGALRDGILTPVVQDIPAEHHTRFNDVIADPAGRVFCGTLESDQGLGNLYRLDLDGSLTMIQPEVTVSNGMGFTPGRNGLYHTDSHRRVIYLYDYDEATGRVENRRDFARLQEHEGYPDGLTVDAEGCVWSARWDGWCVARYDPDGKEMLRVRLPTPKVSSLLFAGPDFTDLYVTTAGGHDKAANGPHAGALFRLNLGIRGVPEFTSRITVS